MILEYKQTLSLAQIPKFTKHILEKISLCCVSEDALFGIRLSLEEALINAIKHGNKNDKNKILVMRIEADSKMVEIDIKDQGEGFDYAALAVPTDNSNLEKTGGRGVFLIKNFMDKVDYMDNGSRVKMTKYLIQGGTGNEDK